MHRRGGAVPGGFATKRGVNPSRLKLLLPLFLGLVACDREEKEASAPPPPTPAIAKPCAGTSASPVAGLPGAANGYCVDPRSDVRRYGVSEAAPLDAVCVELFNGECELYKSFGLEGVKTLRYIPEDGGRREVSVVVSTFRRSSGAFGFFTRRILGDDLPSRVTVAPISVSGRAVSGVGMALVWRGKAVVEMTYVSEEQTPQEIEQESPQVLHPLAKAVSEVLVGPTEPERPVRLVEEMGADPLGASAMMDGVLGVSGSGPHVLGYFSAPPTPHRIVIAERRDEEGSRDLLQLLRRVSPHQKLKNRDIFRLRRTREGAPPETWYVARRDATLLAVGPLDLEASAAQSTPQDRKEEDAKWESFAIRRITQALAADAKLPPE